MTFDATEHPHRRYNPLTGEWILVSPHRTKRPWQGGQEKPPPADRRVYDPDCYLCPGNLRANGDRNPVYDDTFVFVNDFAAVLPDVPNLDSSQESLLRMRPVRGEARVICFSPRHDLTLAQMSTSEIEIVIDLWAQQTADLGRRYKWVQVFENRGELMGASNPHPHGQIWATSELGDIPGAEDRHQREYYERRGSALLLDYVGLELDKRERLVLENETWIVVVPYWAVWPFETLLLPRRHRPRLPDLDRQERRDLAEILKRLLIRYDNIFEVSFPYSTGWHGAPFDGGDHAHWQVHAHFYPPLLRSATVKKFMVGYEMLAEAQRDITAEQAAERLRNLPDTHYKLR
ncbi:MAG: UDP-glucose--hexose-1-phosphate uridylyltransferase [Chloroflexi bacterium]|nr:UDP-glucose--hexose-1-phosphate uridylyltransferase [Chloroflexota bacterium]